MGMISQGKLEEERMTDLRGPRLEFEEETKQLEMFRSENLTKQAIQNIKERRQRQKKSEIFGT